MTEKMQNLLARESELQNKIEALMASDKMGTQEATDALNEMEETKTAIANLEKAESLDKKGAENKRIPSNKKPNGFTVVVNSIKTGRFVNELGEALKTGGLNGENYLLPEDVQLAIRDMKKQWKSAKDIINVEPTTALSGSFNYGKDPEEGLIDFTDGDEVDSSKLPEFTQKKYNVKWVGAAIPVSNILAGAERAELMPYLRKWFVRRSIITENKDIFAALKANYNGGTAKSLANERALSKSINTDLDPAYKESTGMRIVTNQSGFNYLDEQVDGNGRPLLQPDPTAPTRKMYKGITIDVFSDKQLKNEGGKAPIIYGNLEEALTMKSYEDFLYDSDNGKGMGFLKNQTLLKVIEGYALVPTITDAYIYGLLTISGTMGA